MNDRILVVDDDAMIRELLGAMLVHGGFAPILAQSGEEALAICEREVPRVAFIDLVMPENDGLELAGRLRQRWPGTRLFALSGHAPVTFKNAWQDVGFEAFLKKPIDLQALLAAAQS